MTFTALQIALLLNGKVEGNPDNAVGSFGRIEELTGSMKNSVLVVMCFFIIGFIILYFALMKQKQLALEDKAAGISV